MNTPRDLIDCMVILVGDDVVRSSREQAAKLVAIAYDPAACQLMAVVAVHGCMGALQSVPVHKVRIPEEERAKPATVERLQRALTSLRDELLGLVASLRDDPVVKPHDKANYTTAEVAERLGRSDYTVRSWIKDGRLKASRVAESGMRGRLLVPHSEIARLLSQAYATTANTADAEEASP